MEDLARTELVNQFFVEHSAAMLLREQDSRKFDLPINDDGPEVLDLVWALQQRGCKVEIDDGVLRVVRRRKAA